MRKPRKGYRGARTAQGTPKPVRGDHPAARPSNRLQALNAWVCEEGHYLLSLDLHRGTTPMLLHCKRCAENGLIRSMSSMFYNQSRIRKAYPNKRPDYEWYKPHPNSREWRRNKEHCESGGLVIRKIKR